MSDPEETSSPSGAELVASGRRRILGSVGLAVSGQAAAILAGLLCMIVTTRLLGPTGYGRLAIFFFFLEILSQLTGWPNLGLVRFGREEMAKGGGLARTFWARTALFVASLSVVTALIFAFRAPLDRYLELEYAPHLLLLAYAAVNEAIFVCRGVFQTVNNFGAYAAATGGIRVLNLLFIVMAFVVLRWPAGPGGILAAQLASIGVVLLLAAALLPWRLLLPVATTWRAARNVFAYSWPVIFGGFSSLVVNWVDLVVIKHYRSADEVGLYAAAYQPVTVLTALQVAAAGALLPLVVSLAIEKRREALRWYVQDALPQAAWGLGGLCILLAACAEAIPWALGQSFSASVAPCQVLMVGLGFAALATFHSVPLQALDRTRAVAAAYAVVAAANLVLDLLLVPRIGILGAAIATGAAFVLGTFLLSRAARGERFGVTLLGLLPAVGFAALTVLLSEPWQRLLAAGIAIVIWAVLAKAAGVFQPGTLDRLQDVAMPGWVRTMARGFYRLLGRGQRA
jgi:O-antigen/teichoic acid export membrane protein